MDIFRFVKKNCSKNIRSLVLCSSSNPDPVYINESLMAVIGDQINHLYAFASSWMRFSELRVLLYHSNTGTTSWMTETFPNLQILYFSESDLDEDCFTHFLRNHKQIQIFGSDNFSALKSVLASNINPLNVVFDHIIEGGIEKTLNLVDQYYSNSKSFELDVRWIEEAEFTSVLDRIAGMEKVTKLHCGFEMPELQLLNGVNIQLPHIREWEITEFVSITRDELKLLVKTFPNVIDLIIYTYSQPAMSPNEFVSIIVVGLPKLENLHITDVFSPQQYNDDLQNWNAVRLSIENAPVVTVYVRQESDYNIDGFKSNGVLIKPEIKTIYPKRRWDFDSTLNYLDNSSGLQSGNKNS